MQEVKPPKKPLLYYYCIAMLVLLVLNAFLFPRLMQAQVEEVGYNTFMEMMEKQQIAQVQIESSQIIFSDKNSPTGYYKTGPMEDPALVDRLYASGATFGTEIVKQQPFLVTFLLPWILPIIVMVAIGQFAMRKKMKGYTVHALELGLKQLDNLALDDKTKTDIVNQSVERGWRGLFPLKNKNSSKDDFLTREDEPF